MNFLCFKSNPIYLTAIVVLLFGALSYSNAQEATSALSGRVVDVEGNPVAYLPIAVQSVEISNDDVDPMYFLDELEPTLAAYAALPKSQTDEAGQFSHHRYKTRSHSILGTTGRTTI